MKASDIVVDSNTSILLKGPFGHGKTLALATFALEGPLYLAYFDKKKPIELVTFFKQFGEKGRKILSNIEYDIYSSSNANEYLNKLMQLSKDCRYFAVGTDSVTNLTSAAVNWSLGFRDNKKAKDKDKIMPDFDEYKVETSLVSQALDICRTLPCHILWTAHPIPGIKIEGSGSNIRVTKVNPIVTYGSKVAGIVPGNFSEIYHFVKMNDYDTTTGKSKIKYGVSFDAIGDDFAKSNIGLKGEIDITDRFFFEVWKESVNKHMKELDNNDLTNQTSPVTQSPQFVPQFTQPNTQPNTRKWNAERGEYE